MNYCEGCKKKSVGFKTEPKRPGDCNKSLGCNRNKLWVILNIELVPSSDVRQSEILPLIGQSPSCQDDRSDDTTSVLLSKGNRRTELVPSSDIESEILPQNGQSLSQDDRIDDAISLLVSESQPLDFASEINMFPYPPVHDELQFDTPFHAPQHPPSDDSALGLTEDQYDLIRYHDQLDDELDVEIMQIIYSI
eukprot:m.26307 g.26307  ORF g.26307 m.26307 type:complete len:193 (+) comp15352_c0_seq1:749-1327(+)